MSDNTAAVVNTAEKPTEAKPATSDPMSKLASALYDKPVDGKPINGQAKEGGVTKEDLTRKGEGMTPEARAELRAGIAQELAKIEGLDSDHATTKEFTDLASQLGLSGEGAKKLVAFDEARRETAWTEIGDNWLAAAERSPTFKEDVQIGNELLNRFGDEQLMSDLGTYKLGNHPGLISTLGRIGRALRAGRR